MVAAIEADLAPVSILVNNAGVASRGKPVADTDAAEVEKLLAIHAVGAHRLSRLCLPQLRRHDRSDIVIISSVATLNHAANGAPYTMAKAAGEALAPTLAQEAVKNGVRVNIRSEEHTSELQSLMRTSYAVFCLKKTNNQH